MTITKRIQKLEEGRSRARSVAPTMLPRLAPVGYSFVYVISYMIPIHIYTMTMYYLYNSHAEGEIPTAKGRDSAHVVPLSG